jgi:hypothetical protein
MFVGCSSRENPSVLTDTVGATFGWSCPSTGCQLDNIATQSPLPTDCPVGAGWGWIAGRFFSLCYFEPDSSGNGGFTIFDESCRPVVCNADDDCPYAAFGDNIVYGCHHGLCESQEALFQPDVEMLCLAGTTRPATCNIGGTQSSPTVAQIISEVSATCPAAGPCNVPGSCRQP